MEISLIFTHSALAIALFLTINWIGGHSLTAGYIQMSVLIKADEAPAFNFIYRAFAPVVFMTLSAALFYKLDFNWVVEDIYFVVIYYFIFRLVFNIITGRARLLNWGVQASYWITSIPIAFYAYENIILKNEYFFPSDKNLGSALWLGVIAFIYHTFNRIKLSNEKTKQRKDNYIKHRYDYYKSMYEHLINEITSDKRQQCLIYTILLYEAFNRPKIYRWIERMFFHLGLAKTLGVMQVTTDKMITDEESVQLGAQKIVDDHLKAQIIIQDKRSRHSMRSYWPIRNEVIALYNRDDDYVHEVNRLYEEMVNLFYPEFKDDWKKEIESYMEAEKTAGEAL